MRTFFYTLAFAALSCTTSAQDATKASGGPMISIDKEDVDYGTIKQGADGNREFVVTNTGDAPLIISNCAGSCGCTVPKCDNAPILPGKTSTVNVHYDTNRVGPFTKSVTVTSNAANAPTKVVNIHGTVEAGEPVPATTPVKEAAPMAPATAPK
jgi:hypothetical protein